LEDCELAKPDKNDAAYKCQSGKPKERAGIATGPLLQEADDARSEKAADESFDALALLAELSSSSVMAACWGWSKSSSLTAFWFFSSKSLRPFWNA